MNDFAINYLSHYGYLRGNIRSLAVDSATAGSLMSLALVAFQNVAGLPPTGELDDATEAKMRQPRCGCLDIQRSGVLEAKWRKTNLTYRIAAYVGGLSKADVDDLVALAWGDWMAVANIRLTPTLDTNADIVISAGRGRGDGFDGPSGTLAYAYLPNGDDRQLVCKFDLDETWVKSGGGIWFRNVAAHEFGHLLGLEHSRIPTALMAAFYSQAVASPKQADDIPKIRALYGPASNPPPPPGPLPGPNVIRFGKVLPTGTYGDISLGSTLGPGDYLAILQGDSEPPPTVPGE